MTPPPGREAFDAYKSETLGAVLTQAGVSALPKSKEDRVSLWMLLAPDRKRIERSLSQLTPRCRKALELLQAAGGEMRTSRYESLLTRAGLIEKQSRPKKPAGRWAVQGPEQAVDPITFHEVLAALVKHGLAWTHGIPGGPSIKLTFDMPGRFVAVLPMVAPHLPPPSKGAEPVREAAYWLEGSARTCQRDLYLLWSTAREAPFQAVATGLLRMSDLKRISSQLLVQETIGKGAKESDHRRVFFLRRLAEKLNLLHWRHDPGGSQLNAKVDPPFLRADPALRVRNSFLAWRNGDWWNELWATYVPGITRANGAVVDFTPPKVVEARQTVLDEIARRAKAGETWLWLDTISLTLSMRNESFLVDRAMADAQRPTYYGSRFVTSSPYLFNSLLWVWEIPRNDEELGWRTVEEVFIRSVIAEGLYWLGLVDLGYLEPAIQTGGGAPDKIAAIRLTEMGRWLLIDGPQPVIPEEAGRVVVQPNFRIFAFDPIADRVLARLDTFATRLNAERAIEYEVTRDTIYRALLAGQSAGGIKSWLVETSGNPIPQNVERSLDEWQAAFDRIVIRRHVAVVQAATPELVDTLLAIKSIQKAILRRASETLVLVDPKQLDAVEQALIALDEMPARTGGAADALSASITVDADGTIGFVHGHANLYVLGRLQPFTETDDATRRITAASVRRANDSGIDAQAILGELQRLVAAPLPPALESRIKAWSKHYGEAVIQSVTLVEFQDQATLEELLADPEIGRYLKPFKPGAGLGLALIASADLAAAARLLTDRGVAVHIQ